MFLFVFNSTRVVGCVGLIRNAPPLFARPGEVLINLYCRLIARTEEINQNCEFNQFASINYAITFLSVGRAFLSAVSVLTSIGIDNFLRIGAENLTDITCWWSQQNNDQIKIKLTAHKAHEDQSPFNENGTLTME